MWAALKREGGLELAANILRDKKKNAYAREHNLVDIDLAVDGDASDLLVRQSVSVVERMLAVDAHIEHGGLTRDAQLEARALLEHHWAASLLLLPSSSLRVADDAAGVEARVDV